MTNDLIENYGERITRKQFAPSSFVKGVYANSKATETEILAVITPLDAEDMQLLPAGRNIHSAINIYSVEQLKTGSEVLKTRADRVLWRNQEYEILSAAERYQIDSLEHYKAIGILFIGVT